MFYLTSEQKEIYIFKIINIYIIHSKKHNDKKRKREKKRNKIKEEENKKKNEIKKNETLTIIIKK